MKQKWDWPEILSFAFGVFGFLFAIVMGYLPGPKPLTLTGIVLGLCGVTVGFVLLVYKRRPTAEWISNRKMRRILLENYRFLEIATYELFNRVLVETNFTANNASHAVCADHIDAYADAVKAFRDGVEKIQCAIKLTDEFWSEDADAFGDFVQRIGEVSETLNDNSINLETRLALTAFRAYKLYFDVNNQRSKIKRKK